MNLTPNEVLIIALVALIVLGPQRLPDAARQIGKGYRELRKMSTSVRAEIDTALKEPVEAITQPIEEIRGTITETVTGEQARPARGPQPAPGVRGPHASTSSTAPTPQSKPPAPPNSAYRPADELPADELPDSGATNGGTANQ